jgi:hypothetical protein
MNQRNNESTHPPTVRLGRTISEPSASSLNLQSTMERRKSASDIIGSLNDKHVQFSTTAKVVLIPCLNEYRAYELDDQLWWKEDDYLQFKLSASSEVSHLIKLGGDIKNLIRKFYQLEPEEDAAVTLLSAL